MIYIDRDSRMPLYEQIYQSLKEDILTGRLMGGAKLVATRRLSQDLMVGRNTVENAYQQLLIEGYVTSRVGSGYTVCSLPPHKLSRAPVGNAPVRPAFVEEPARLVCDFCPTHIEARAFPANDLRKQFAAQLMGLGDAGALVNPHPQGDARLRGAVAEYLYSVRGIRCSMDNIIIVCSHQYSLDMLCTLLGDRRLAVAMEEPGHIGARAAFHLKGIPVRPVPVERDGVCVEEAVRAGANLLYLTPSHQYPTGGVLSIKKRLEIIAWAASTDSYIIENDHDSELKYNTRPVPALYSMDGNDRVVYLGILSRPIAVQLGIAYMILPDRLMEDYRKRYHMHYNSVPPLNQQVAAAYIASGDCERQLDRFRVASRKKHDLLLGEFHRLFGERVTVSASGGGLHLLLQVHSPMEERELIASALKRGVRLYPVSDCWAQRQNAEKKQVMLGYGGVPIEGIPRALRLLNEAWFAGKVDKTMNF